VQALLGQVLLGQAQPVQAQLVGQVSTVPERCSLVHRARRPRVRGLREVQQARRVGTAPMLSSSRRAGRHKQEHAWRVL
jgi:hypothetical protein